MADNQEIQHRPSMFSPTAGSQALSDAMAANAAKWRQINSPDQFNRGPYSPALTGNPLMDMGLNMAGSMAYRKAGGQGQPRYMMPFTPGVSAMQNDMGGNYIGPMQQQMMQDFNRHTQPLTEMGLQSMNMLGFGKQAARLKQTMGQSSFMTDLAAMGNQSPYIDAIMGGNMFRGHQQLLNRAGSFQTGGPLAINPEMQMARSVAAVHSANAAGRAVVDMTYRDPMTGKFNVAGNTRYTGGWGGEDMQRLTAEMASRNVSQEMTMPDGSRAMIGMSNMGANPYVKAGMVGRMGRATSAMSAITGETDPVENMRMLQQNVGGGRSSRNLDTLMREASSLATIGGVAAIHGIDRRSAFATHQGVLAGIDNRLSNMMDPSGGSSMNGTAMGRAMARSATIGAINEAGMTGARSPQDMAELTNKYGQRQLSRFKSAEGRETMLAMHAMETTPAAAIYRQQLEQSLQQGSTGRTKEIIQQISEAAYGKSSTIATTAMNNRAFADSMKSSEMWEQASGKDPEAIADRTVKLLNSADKSENAIGRRLLFSEGLRNTSRNAVKRMNLKSDPDKMADSKVESIYGGLDKLMVLDKDGNKVKAFSPEELGSIRTTVGDSKGQEALRKLKDTVKSYYGDTSKGNVKAMVKDAEMDGETVYNKGLVSAADVSKTYGKKWLADTGRDLNNLKNGTAEQQAAHKEKLRKIDKLEGNEKGKALEDYMKSEQFAAIDTFKYPDPSDPSKMLVGHGKFANDKMTKLSKDREETKTLIKEQGKQPVGGLDPAERVRRIMNSGMSYDEAVKAAQLSGGEQSRLETFGKSAAGQEFFAQTKAAGAGWKGGKIMSALKSVQALGYKDTTGAAKHGAAALGYDTSELDTVTKSGGQDQTGGAGRGQNAVTEVVLKAGQKFYIVKSDGSTETMSTRGT